MSALPDMAPRRPLLRYHGGKLRLAPWIIQRFPPHRVYTEVCGGAGSVLLQKPRSYAEVYNDLDGEICNLFRVLRNPTQARELVRLVSLTPYAREEFELAWLTDGDPVEQARRTLFRSAAGFGTSGASGQWRTGFRGAVTQSGSTPAQDWQGMPAVLEAVADRLRGVVIEQMDAADCLRKYDDTQALHYIDPPYPQTTRGARWRGHAYRHEMSDDDHRRLAATVHALKGAVVISGYACELYDRELYAGWDRYEVATHADGGRDRVEALWVKPGVTPQMRLL